MASMDHDEGAHEPHIGTRLREALQSRRSLWFCFEAGGIIGMLVIYGFMQERVMTKKYGPRQEEFQWSPFLVLCNRFYAVVLAVVLALAQGESLVMDAPLWKYLVVSISNVIASTCQYDALKYVTFPMQIIGKSFKMMPVMVWGIIISSKRYSLKDWAIATMVTGGVMEFLTTGPIEAEDSSSDQNSSAYGLFLLACFLAFDGLTSTMQEKLFKEHETTKYNQMSYINGFSALASVLMLVCSNQVPGLVGFIGRNPIIMSDASVLSIGAVGGQFFIYSMVQDFGALAFAATMNVRQVVSLLVSYIQYGHHVTALQILGLIAIFGALFYKSFSVLGGAKKSEEETRESKEKQPLMLNVATRRSGAAEV